MGVKKYCNSELLPRKSEEEYENIKHKWYRRRVYTRLGKEPSE
jgi:hypothetical protein